MLTSDGIDLLIHLFSSSAQTAQEQTQSSGRLSSLLFLFFSFLLSLLFSSLAYFCCDWKSVNLFIGNFLV